MNDAHLHLVVNHLPIVGILIGTLILIAGLILKKTEVKLTALGVFVFSAIASILPFIPAKAQRKLWSRFQEPAKHLYTRTKSMRSRFIH